MDKRLQGYSLALISVALVSVAQLSLKLAMTNLPALAELVAPGTWQGFSEEQRLALSLLGTGLLCYGVSVMVWIAVLTRLPLSTAYPLLSISYIVVYWVATQFAAWGEVATVARTSGIMFILIGVYLVSRPALTRLDGRAD